MYHDLLAKTKNAVRAKKESFMTAYSGFDFDIGKVLADKGYLGDIQKKIVGGKSFLEVKMAYKKGKPTLNDFRIISRPSRHIYAGYRDARRVKQGHGIGVFSTSAGIMTDGELRKKKVGGEYLFEIW